MKHKAKEQFFSSYNELNENYKKVLYATGQNQSESVEFMISYENSLKNFKQEYQNNPISEIKDIEGWQNSLKTISQDSKTAKTFIDSGDFQFAHLELEKVREEFQKVFEREKISMLGVLMTDFHDKMEVAIELANEKKYSEISQLCTELNKSWKAVEDAKTDFSGEELFDYQNKVKLERETLDKFCNQANNNDEQISSVASELKKNFISVYLKYG